MIGVLLVLALQVVPCKMSDDLKGASKGCPLSKYEELGKKIVGYKDGVALYELKRKDNSPEAPQNADPFAVTVPVTVTQTGWGTTYYYSSQGPVCEDYKYAPQRDVTVYELALLLPHVAYRSSTVCLLPEDVTALGESIRHFQKVVP
jgi:hypothetical protein